MAERSNVGSSKRVVRISHTELVNIANQLKSEPNSENSKLDVKITGKEQSSRPPKRLNRGEALDEKSSSPLSSHSRRMSSPAAQASRKLSGVQKSPSVDSGPRSERAMSERPSSRPQSSMTDRDDERKLGRARRPDIQIYIPKPKMAMLRENLVPKEAAPESSSEKLGASSSGMHRPKPRQRTLSEQSGSQEVRLRQEERFSVGDSGRGADSTPTLTRTSPRSKRNKDKNKKREHEKRSPLSTRTSKDFEELARGDVCESSLLSCSHGGTIEQATSSPKESFDSSTSRVPNLSTERVADASKTPVVCCITYDGLSASSFQSTVPSGDVRLSSNLLSAGSGSGEIRLPSVPSKGRGRLGRHRCETTIVGQSMAGSDSTTSTSGIMTGIQKLRIDLEPESDSRLVQYAMSSPEPVQEVTTDAASVQVPEEVACNSAVVGDVDECSKDDDVEPKAQVDETCDEPTVVQTPPRRILDWSAEVEASEENDELSENWSPVWPSQMVDDEMSKEELVRSASKPRKLKKKRKESRSATKQQVKETVVDRPKSSPKPKKTRRRPERDFATKTGSPLSDQDAKTPESSGKSGGGIIHLPPSVESTLAIVENACVPLAERDYGKKQLYDPDHPERPLCVVTPASHVSPYEHYHSGQSPPPAVQRTTFPYPGPGSAMGRPPSIPPQFVTPQNFYAGFATGFPQVPLPPRGPLYFPMTPGMHPGIPADFSTNSSNVMYKLSATEKNVREAMILETELNMMLNQPFGATDPKKLGQCRWKIQLRYENTILSDMEFCMKHNVEQTLWRAAFYQVIESYRRQMVEDPTRKEEIRTALISLIDEGIVFYENLLEKMQETYGFSLNDFLDSNALRPQTLSRTLKSTVMSAQKVTICLGDLARYREYACDSSNYGKARSWYLKAQQLAPKNGRPYNQLAILAVYARRKLDAVYYYMRSLAASNAFQTAKEGLISIFDDARKKYEQQDKSREEARRSSKNSQNSSKSGGKRRKRGSRQQTVIIWYTPEGAVANQGLVEDDDNDESNRVDEDDDDLSNLQPVELNKRFSLSFLHIHGKLYSRVGMETFAEAFVRMLREFRLLLRTRPPTMMANRLLQIITINMYAIYKAGHEATDAVPVESHCQTVIQGRALEVGVEMFRLLVERCCELLGPAPPTAETFSDDLEQLLPAVKIWCDWFMCHPAVWNPLPSLTDLGDASDKRDVWTELAQLLNLFKEVDTGMLLEDAQDGCELLVLPEDVALAGFIPLLSLSEKAIYVLPPVNKDLARNLLRVHRIVFCTSGFLCGLPSPVLAFDVDSRQYVAVSNDLVDEPVKVQTRLSESDLSEEPVEKIEESTEDWDNCWPDDPTCHHLRTRKQQLEKVKAHQEMQQQQIQAVLQEASQAGNIRFEVYPQWLVPDTNCFIDHLAHIRVLARHGKFHLAVPLVVINELDGLAQGQRAGEILVDATAQAHAYMVSHNAQDALQFLTDCFQSHNPHVRAVTAKGSLLGTIAFRSEETYDKLGTNDDIILACCIKLCEEQSFGRTKFQKFKRKDGIELICRNVVLLTDDRNLRVKAHAYDMAVEAVPRFAELMNVHG